MRKNKKFYDCNRCGHRTFEFLVTYGHCVNCLDVKEIRGRKFYEQEWEKEYRSQFSDLTSYQNFLRSGGEL